ncbi:hypothetical protein GAY28_29995, partial [Azospirillum brasilense]|nr:hypothetical protein [Azospirillum brasilense]
MSVATTSGADGAAPCEGYGGDNRVPSLSKGLAMVAVAAALAGCQFPGFQSPQQTATLPPPTVPKPPPEERGIWIVGSPSMRGAVGPAASRFNSTPDTQPRLVAEGTNSGFRSFCAGVGPENPDMVASDRRSGAGEKKSCRAQGTTRSRSGIGTHSLQCALT